MLLATVVDTSALLKVIVASVIATIGVTAAFSLAIVGTTRFGDMQRESRRVEAGAFAVLAVLSLAVCAFGVVEGMIVMTSK
jgi:NADH:ubiquinone oxidoreductase subunit 4 (subunit M)